MRRERICKLENLEMTGERIGESVLFLLGGFLPMTNDEFHVWEPLG